MSATEKQKDNSIKMESQELESKTEDNKTNKSVALLKTEKGDIKIQLYLDEAPITAGNFKDLVERGFYNGITFHRIITGFVVQGGCPEGTGTGNFVDPETGKTRYVKMEKTKFKHDKEGVVAMARTSDPNSASSQFFIDLAPLPSLDAGGVDPYGYAIFGQVIDGMDVVKKIVEDNVPPFPGDDGCSNPVKITKAEMI
ncbi:MAG: peptidylprolyl isomerase [Candidatus Caenarcaniphilales bacterium]|nr:peptidylprolyl isomerase [Candidatus Caenarcaniphilales bacterium]